MKMEKRMNHFIDKLSDILTPIAAKMQEFHLIMALTETMQQILPVTIIGSFACLDRKSVV